MFLTALPLADEPGGHVEVAGEHSLARLLAQANLPDLLGRQLLDRRQAHLVEGSASLRYFLPMALDLHDRSVRNRSATGP